MCALRHCAHQHGCWRRQLAAAQEARNRACAAICRPWLRTACCSIKNACVVSVARFSVLFADVVNFTQLSVSLDAEAVFNLINGLLGRMVECIHRYDGMVDKFVGDGLMAVFGAPIAHENDPELAVRAALDMQRAAAEFEPVARAQVGAPLQIRIGINSGPAVAGVIGTDAAGRLHGDRRNRQPGGAPPVGRSARWHPRQHASLSADPGAV